MRDKQIVSCVRMIAPPERGDSFPFARQGEVPAMLPALFSRSVQRRVGAVVAVIPLLLCGWAPIAAGQTAVDAEPLRLVVHRVVLDRLAADHAELSVEADAVAGVDAELKTLRLSGVRLDGTPVYVDPLAGQIELRRGVPLQLPRVRMVVYYTDLPTPTALDNMLAVHHVRVTAEVRAQLQASILSKLLMGDLHPVAALPIDEQAGFDRAAVDPGIQAGVGLLSLAQQALGATVSVAEQLTGMQVSLEANPVSEAERRGLLLVRTTFRTRGSAQQRVCERLGIWLDDEYALVPAEALKPWAYSLSTTETSSGERDDVDPGSVQTVLVPFGADATSGSVAEIRNFKVHLQGRGQESRVISPARKQITVLERSSLGNFAILHVNGTGDAHDAPGGFTGARSWGDDSARTLRVYRYNPNLTSRLRFLQFDDDEASAGTASLLHRLPRPVDSSMFGSPVLLGGEPVGMVVSETSWIGLPAMGRGDVGDSRAVATPGQRLDGN